VDSAPGASKKRTAQEAVLTKTDMPYIVGMVLLDILAQRYLGAARYDNVNFIIVLRDEMKKRGKKPVAVMGGERSDSMIKLLKQYGIEIDDQCRE